MEGGRLIVTIDTHAATPAEAERIVQRLISPTGILQLNNSLATAPPKVSVSGLSCRLEANAEYTLQPSLLNAKPQYAKEDGAWHVYWTTNSGTVDAWVIDAGTDDTIVSAYLASSAIVPPDGTARWVEFCGDGHDSHGGLGVPTLVTLDAPLSAANCAALATNTLRQPVCENVPWGQCSPACALPWLDASALCDGKNAAAFAAIVPGASIACFATAAASSVLSETTAIIHVLEVHDFTFEAVSGTRYNVRVRVGGRGQWSIGFVFAQRGGRPFDRRWTSGILRQCHLFWPSLVQRGLLRRLWAAGPLLRPRLWRHLRRGRCRIRRIVPTAAWREQHQQGCCH